MGKYMLTIFHQCYLMGKSDHYAVTNVHLGIFLPNMISSKTSNKIITAIPCTHWYKSTEERYGLNCATHSMIKIIHI